MLQRGIRRRNGVLLFMGCDNMSRALTMRHGDVNWRIVGRFEVVTWLFDVSRRLRGEVGKLTGSGAGAEPDLAAAIRAAPSIGAAKTASTNIINTIE